MTHPVSHAAGGSTQQRPTVSSAQGGSQSDISSKVNPGVMSRLSHMELQHMHDEDQVQTFATEGTPMNFLSTATSMNELNKVTATI